MVVAASQNPLGVDPQPHAQSISSGAAPGPGARHAGPNPYRGPNPNHQDRQQQGNWPFFYVHPSQHYTPCQWPVPMPYVHYGGFPGLGYGMVPPPFPPVSYVDAPHYILPHTQLHMVDYRRMMAPQLAPTMAYQARRFRFQHAPSGRVMVSSEVQTEPVCIGSSQQVNDTSAQSSSESGGSTNSTSVLSPHKPSEDEKCSPEKGCAVFSTRMAGEMARIATVQNGGILFQSEEVRIECTGSPSAVKITHSKETTELASKFDSELLQCNIGHADDVLRCFQPVPFGDDEERKGTTDITHFDDPCPDILMVSYPSNGSVSATEGSKVAPVEPVNGSLVVPGYPSLVECAQDICENQKNTHFKILRLPVDLQCTNELQQMEASIWSVESLMPYVPTSEWLMQNGLMTPGKQSLATVMEVSPDDPVQLNQSWGEPSVSLLDSSSVIELDGQDSMPSVESLPPFSLANKLSDSGNASSNVHKLSNAGNQTKTQPEPCHDAKVQSEIQDPNVAPLKKLKEEMSKQSVIMGLDLSDQEHSVPSLPPDSHLKHKVCLCKSCAVKCSRSLGSKTGCVKCRKVSCAQVMGGRGKVQLCDKCVRHLDKKARCKGTSTNSESNTMMNSDASEVSENDVYPSKKLSRKLYNHQNPPSGKHSGKCPMLHQSKLKEQNCLCEDVKDLRSHPAWSNNNNNNNERNLIWERNGENLALSPMEMWNDTEHVFTGERSRRGSMQVSDNESTKSGGRMRTCTKQKHAQSLEVHRRDTRC